MFGSAGSKWFAFLLSAILNPSALVCAFCSVTTQWLRATETQHVLVAVFYNVISPTNVIIFTRRLLSDLTFSLPWCGIDSSRAQKPFSNAKMSFDFLPLPPS